LFDFPRFFFLGFSPRGRWRTPFHFRFRSGCRRRFRLFGRLASRHCLHQRRCVGNDPEMISWGWVRVATQILFPNPESC
jgi:hypothetical protein